MDPRDKKRPTNIRTRHWSIIEDHYRHRVMIPRVIHARHFPNRSLNAVTKVTARLVRAQLLSKYPLFHPRVYFTLGPIATRHLGVPLSRSEPLGPQSLPIEYTTMLYATTIAHQRTRLTSEELQTLLPDLPLALCDFPYCLDQSESTHVLELIRVDLGGKPDHVARKCGNDIELRSRVSRLQNWIADGRFRLVVLTGNKQKAAALRNALNQRFWPSGLVIHLVIVPDLLHLTASTNHGA